MESKQNGNRKEFQKGFINLGIVILLFLISGLGLLDADNSMEANGIEDTIANLTDDSHIRIIHIQSGNSINAEIARSSLKRQIGLMNRLELDDEGGMFFIFEKEQNLTFWMKNTFISLDIIFLDSNLKVVQFFENTSPNQTFETYSASSAIYVLETLTGFSSRSQLKIGDSFEITE